MANKTNPEWIKHEFREKVLTTKQLRHAIVHASIVEGILRNVTKFYSFSAAILTLLLRDKISKKEAILLNEISQGRNTILHGITDESKLPDQRSIDERRDTLMENIRKLYKGSKFYNKNLFERYCIERPQCIPFIPFED